MTPADLIAIGKERHGERWMRPLADELCFDRTTIWRAATSDKPLSRDLTNALKLLARREASRTKATKHPTRKDP